VSDFGQSFAEVREAMDLRRERDVVAKQQDTEIERLRAVADAARQYLDWTEGYEGTADEGTDYHARLRGALAKLDAPEEP
jgi:hypothetical protein